MKEIDALQNAADSIGLTIHEKSTDDKRKTVKHYFAKDGPITIVSPALDYDQMNHFILGWWKCMKHINNIRK